MMQLTGLVLEDMGYGGEFQAMLFCLCLHKLGELAWSVKFPQI
jgi:hypothetical protein